MPEKEITEKIEDYKTEELWDLICSNVGFDRNGKEIQADIRKFVELKLAQEKQKAIDNCLREHSFKCAKILREARKEEFHRGWNNCEKFYGIKKQKIAKK